MRSESPSSTKPFASEYTTVGAVAQPELAPGVIEMLDGATSSGV